MRVPNVGEQLGRYQLDRVLGRGGMGVVFAATDPRLQRTVALKVITGTLASSHEFRQRFQAEAAALARLDSPHVIAIHDHDEVDGTPYIVTQYVDGRDLWSWLREHGPMPARQALGLCAQLARGLADAHRVGVVHRDVKPSNVLIRDPGTPEQHAYLCDFGIARAEGIEGPAPTAAGSVAGTWTYLSPERAEGLPATPSSDVYALGCVLWACLTGHEPYQGSDVQVALAHQQAPIPRLAGDSAFTADLNAVIGRALAKDPTQRYADATSFREDLERLAAVAPPDAQEAPPSPTDTGTTGTSVRPAASAVRRRSRWPLAVAGVVALALVAGGAAWLVGRDDAPAAEGKADEPAPVIAGDVTGDGYGDVLIHQTRFESLNPLSVFTVASTGMRFGSPQRAGAQVGYPFFADVDGDRARDVVWLDEDDDRMAITVVPGDGETWSTELDLDPAFDIKPYSATAGDLDGDGRDDLVLYGDETDERDGLYVALARDRGFAAPEQWYSSDLSSSLPRVGDFDGDGKVEVICFGENPAGDDTVRLLRPEDGRFVMVAEKVLGGAGVAPLLAEWLVGDVDGDGTDELVAPNATGRVIFVYEIADDAFQPRTRWHATPVPREQARKNAWDSGVAGSALSDVDGDGDDDLVELRYTANDNGPDDPLVLWVMLSDGASFGDAQEWGGLDCSPECEDGFDLVD
ncbi:protein kinase domain-containing protein [Nocardioides sp. SLBN-35]|uniref:protein kinase domain-containing protein n=1 Tax=Nocardioides sp. SLBN-35 TaxID=2768445 RepID=UPI001152F9EB|nr:protein kinase [Nocardioides sp. SLBN-35]TQK69304.1 serine/threonine protein kinase [Nocardioides sp. SLBN-35]